MISDTPEFKVGDIVRRRIEYLSVKPWPSTGIGRGLVRVIEVIHDNSLRLSIKSPLGDRVDYYTTNSSNMEKVSAIELGKYFDGRKIKVHDERA